MKQFDPTTLSIIEVNFICCDPGGGGLIKNNKAV
jgi:hypothetical protein